MGGPNRTRERLLTATFWIWGGRQADPVTLRAGHPRSMLKAPIEFLRSARLTNIESLCAHLNRNCDRIILSRNTAGEKRTCSYGGAKDGPGTYGSCLGIHVNPPHESVDNGWFHGNRVLEARIGHLYFGMTVRRSMGWGGARAGAPNILVAI